MRVIVGTHELGLGGSETYAITLAEQLLRLGHEVTLCAVVRGAGAETAAERGLEVVELGGEPAGACDAIVAQDGASAFELARHHPGAPIAFVAHSEEFDEQLPPQLEGLVGAVVTLNDRVQRRVRALATDLRVVRLRQPIDVARFTPRSEPAATPRRLLLLGNNADRARLGMVADAAASLGIELVASGARSTPTRRPDELIETADVVMGYGRCVLEAMACGRPAYVYDHLGGDGWVTPETYPALEADGFGGRASATTIDRDRLIADLRAYDPAMGLVNRDLVVRAHRAEHHAQEMVELLRSLGSRDGRANDSLDELSRLVRAQWAADARIAELEATIADLHDRVDAERAAAAVATAQHRALLRTRRYRAGSVLARPVEIARGLRRGGR